MIMVELTDREARPLARLVEYLDGDRFDFAWFFAHPRAEPLSEGQFEAAMRIVGTKVETALANARREREASWGSEVEEGPDQLPATDWPDL